jgi:hypothetical protein
MSACRKLTVFGALEVLGHWGRGSSSDASEGKDGSGNKDGGELHGDL